MVLEDVVEQLQHGGLVECEACEAAAVVVSCEVVDLDRDGYLDVRYRAKDPGYRLFPVGVSDGCGILQVRSDPEFNAVEATDAIVDFSRDFILLPSKPLFLDLYLRWCAVDGVAYGALRAGDGAVSVDTKPFKLDDSFRGDIDRACVGLPVRPSVSIVDFCDEVMVVCAREGDAFSVPAVVTIRWGCGPVDTIEACRLDSSRFFCFQAAR